MRLQKPVAQQLSLSSFAVGLLPFALCCLFFFVPFLAAPETGAPTGFPFHDETLNYTVNWPSGLGLGEAHLRATRTKAAASAEDRWHFDLGLDASVPGFGVSDRYRSVSTVELCSLEFERQLAHGRKKTDERVTIDRKRGVAKRVTAAGGKSEYGVTDCIKDALTFLYSTRRELGQGRVPIAQPIVFGALYSVRLEYTGPQSITVNESRMESDRVVITLKGPASDIAFEIFFARDPARTPLMIRAPLAMGTFSLELTR